MAMAMASTPRDVAITEARLEQLLSEKLMQGFVLMEACCPKCQTPLVKNHHMVPKNLGSFDKDGGEFKVDQIVLLPAESFDQPFKPVDGVPMCVACDSHVITQETEVAILEQSDSMKDKGSIYVALGTNNNIVNKSEPEIINLEDVVEDDVIKPLPNPTTSSYKKPFLVDISTTSFDEDGNSHFEMTFSPREGAESKPINLVEEEEEEEEQDENELPYSARREIATKVLGAKMLQGYTLQEVTCQTCRMPLMSKKSKVGCVVCPVLAKKAKKKLRQKQKIEDEKARLESMIAKRKAIQELEPEMDHVKSVRQAMDEEKAAHILSEEEEARMKADERQKAIEAEKARILALEQIDDENSAPAPVAPPAVATKEAQELIRAQLEAEKAEIARLEAIAKEEDERRKFAKDLREKEEKIASLEAEQKSKQEAEAKALAEEQERINALDDETIANDKSLAIKKDVMVEEHRKRMAGKVTLDEEVARLEEERLHEEMEARRLADEKRAEAESRMIAALEAEAAMKALAAEEAIRKAKEALEDVTATKKHIISQTIALAEKEAIIETEESIKGRFEYHKEPILLPSASEVEKERWETLRLEGRAILTRRIMQGWELLPEACKGSECHMSPLLVNSSGCKECVICGGTGTGEDGVYKMEDTHEQPKASKAPVRPISSEPAPQEAWIEPVEDEDFEKKREVYSKEIGRRMLLGWILIDATCPKCVMPLMMDDLGNTDICVKCGEVKQFDASTIATKEMAALEIVDEASVQQPTVQKSDSDLCSTIQKQATKVQPKKTLSPNSDPPAFNARVISEEEISDENLIPLSTSDFADATAIRKMIVSEEEHQHRDDSNSVDISIEMIANMFLKSPHGYDFEDFGKLMNLTEVKDLVEIFIVTNVDSDVSNDFKYAVAERIMEKMNLPSTGRQQVSPSRSKMLSVDTGSLVDDDDHTATKSTGLSSKRSKPRPEDSGLPPMSPGPRTTPKGGFSRKNTVIVGGPIHTSRGDDMSVTSRASTVASDALESIYDRIDQCKKKLLDPNNTLDEQIATAALLEKLAQAAVAVKEMDFVE